MKPFAAVTLIAALVPAVPAGTATVQAPPQAPAHARVPAARQLAAAPGCPPSGARLRPHDHDHDADAHGHVEAHEQGHGREQGRNDLTPAEAAAVERDLRGVLTRLGLWRPGASAPSPAARRRTAATVKVPVYFHVLHNGTSGNLSDDKIRRQIQVLNEVHGGNSGRGARTGFTFSLSGVTRTNNSSWYSDPMRHEKTFKPKLHKGGAGTLNLYSANMGDDMLGWSSFPWKYKTEPKIDGVVLHPDSLPGGPIENFNLGHTATHEIGHWLGLYHTFQDGCAGAGDRVGDTPAERDPTNGCPSGKDTCPATGMDPVNNFMDYGFDTCMHEFTKGQADRMHLSWKAYRTSSAR
ncbi:zinc metalloprotease [Actinomadura vinacea]|uniref:zinc metalloprotease n=1 Tax=Actinomadura vinacea TaxID=115336 RepID=UPI0031D2CFC8